MSGDSPPRKQHYQFAHRLFRSLMMGRASRFDHYLSSAREGQGDTLCVNMWASAAAQSGEPPIDGHPTVRAIPEGIVVKMPPAVGISEAHFIAVVRAREGQPLRYFTLEKSSFGTSRFCEWNDDTHSLHREMEDSAAAFLAAVRERLDDRG